MKVTYYGHATILLETEKAKLLFDPFISPNELARGVDIDAIKPDYILLTHGHVDHVVDLFTIQTNSDATVICIAEIQGWLNKNDVDKVHGMNIGGSFNFDFGRVKMVNAIHSSSMPDGTYGGNPAGYVIYADGKTVYIAGDTALTYDMKLLEDENLDVAFLPVGDNYTMGPEDAVKAASFINCKNIIGVHFDTFPPIKLDHEAAKAKFAAAGLNFTLPEIGQTIAL
jgi:L-ascorbate metabolism protein UlaG (beta-lactamase superfamily)